MIAKITITIAIDAIIVSAFLRKVMKSTLITSHHYNFCLDHSKTIVGSGLFRITVNLSTVFSTLYIIGD